MTEILQTLTEECINRTFTKPNQELTECMRDFEYIQVPQKLRDFQRVTEALDKCLNRAERIHVEFSGEVIRQQLCDYYEQKIIAHENKVAEVNNSFEQRLEVIEASIVDAAKEYNNKVKDEHDEKNKVYLELEEKRKQLEVYQSKVLDLCELYGITTSDVQIDNSSFTTEELSEVYDQYISFMSKADKRSNPITWFRDSIHDNPIVEGIILLLLLIFSFTLALDIIAIIFVGVIIIAQLRSQRKVKSYAILLGLLYNVQPLAMGFKSEVDETLLITEELDEEDSPELEPFAEEWEAALNKLEEENPQIEMEAVIAEYNSMQGEISTTFNERLDVFNTQLNAFIGKVKSRQEKVLAAYEQAKSEVKFLGQEVQTSAVFNTTFKLGLENNLIEETVDIGLRNIVIRPCMNERLQNSFMQVMLANALCNVKAGQLFVTIYDPNNMGQSLSYFYDNDMSEYFNIIVDKLDGTLEKLRKYVDTNIKTLQSENINIYNLDAEAVRKTPKEYHLLIILSQPKAFVEKEELMEFMSYSARFGVFVWLVTDQNVEGAKVFNKPFEGVMHPYNIERDSFCKLVKNTYIKALKAAKNDSIDWEKDFKDNVIPDEDIWSYIADTAIELNPGYEDGDPSKPTAYTLGHSGDIHGLIVGGTGAGKSVFMHELIVTAARKYSPRELEMWLIDFKGAEFVKYLPRPDDPEGTMLPHIKACLCTSDGNFASSLFDALEDVAKQRYAKLKAMHIDSLKDYNSLVRAGQLYEYTDDNGDIQYTSDPTLRANMRQLGEDDLFPRILCINDEFQVIFENAEDMVKEKIKKSIIYLAKVARAAGIHLLFGSQSMEGTLKADTLDQFTLRFALRCAMDTSRSILGAPFAGEIRQKFGYLYVKCLAYNKPELLRKFRTPGISDATRNANIKLLFNKAKEMGIPPKRVVTYNEQDKAYISDLLQAYKEYPEQLKGAILLGPRMTYSNNRVPDNFRWSGLYGEHLLASFGMPKDLVCFYKSIVTCIKQDESAKLLINAQVDDLHYLCGIDEDVPENQLSLSSRETSVYKLLDFFEKLVKKRKDEGIKDTPYYLVLVGWDQAKGIGVDPDYEVSRRMSAIMQVCAEYHIHFVFITTKAKPLGTRVIDACDLKLAGRCDEDTSALLCNGRIASKVDMNMEDGYFYINRKGVISRCKIFQSPLTREIKSSEVVV